jgi:glycosyltransferase involved in cell wall biosynthesis
MKVLHIIPSISKKRGGPSTAIISMVRELRAKGIDAAILTTTDNCIYRENDNPEGSWFLIESVPVLMFPIIDSKPRFIREYLISIRFLYWLLYNIKYYDLLHVHSIFSYTSTLAMLLARLTKTPYIVRTIGQLNSWSLSQSPVRKRIMLFLIERTNLEKANAIHVTSEYEEKELKIVCTNQNILRLELGVDIPGMIKSLDQKRCNYTRFIFLSRIHPKKQLDKLLYSLSLLQNKYAEYSWKLSIAGDGDYQYLAYLKKYSRDIGIDSHVYWMGHLDHEQKFKLLRESDWYVLPSKSENFGLSVVESLSIGLPVIISSEVGISDYVLHYNAGLVVSDKLSLEKALRLALKGAPMEMRKSAKYLVKTHFSWDIIVKRLIIFYLSQIEEVSKK